MKYNGGKFRQVKHICPIINSFLVDGKVYYEPFVGGMNIPTKVESNNMQLSDGNLAVVSMWQAALDGFDFPDDVTEKAYKAAWDLEDTNPLKAFILVACSFGGIYKGGYARGNDGNYADVGRRSIAKKVEAVKGRCTVFHQLWDDFDAKDAVIYLDPPYKGTRKYPDMPKFDHDEFWEKCRFLAMDNVVLVSETTVPEDTEILWQRVVTRQLANNNATAQPVVTEKLVRVHA